MIAHDGCRSALEVNDRHSQRDAFEVREGSIYANEQISIEATISAVCAY